MKFEDLEFKNRDSLEQCVVLFPNKYGISIITGLGADGNKQNPYECAEIKHDYNIEEPVMNDSEKEEYRLSHEHWFVKGYCNKDKVSELIKEIESRYNPY